MAKKNGIMAEDPLTMAAFILVVVGALNWGLVGLVGVNLVNWLVGSWPIIERGVYVLIGLAGLYKLYYGLTSWK